jgi:Fe2+ or Zn2+ uptake regulation protein
MKGGLPNTVARGKAAATSSITELNPEQKQAGAKQATESNDDVIEEIQGHPQDGHQHVYVCLRCGDHYVSHEQISIDKETRRVERAAKWLNREVHVRGILKNCRRPALAFGHVEMT